MNYKFLFEEKLKCISAFFLFLSLLTGNMAFAQGALTIRGTVLEADTQMPLPGVNVLEKGTNNGTTTDFDGNYSIEVSSPDAIIIISYIGFLTKEINVDGNETINVTLEPELQSLDEVVIIGYGQQRREDVTGSIGSVGADALTERNTTNPLEALQGNVAGVQISQSNGRIGGGYDITIRGVNSLNEDASPLFVVDGVPTEDIDFLNPQDIARMDILKDASSTAIYGSRGSNGVVIVTTKTGASAKPGITVSFDSYVGIKSVTRLPEMMDPQTWWLYHQSAYLGSNPMSMTPESLRDAVDGRDGNIELFRRAAENESYDWYDLVLKSGIQQNNYVNVSGRSESGLGYNIGIGYQTETGNIDNEGLDKYTFKAGLDHRINEKFSAGANFTVALTEDERGSAVAMREAFRLNPFLSPYGPDGELYPEPGKLESEPGSNFFLIDKTSTYNPLLEIANTSDQLRRWNAIASAYLEYRTFDWLTLKTSYSAGLDTSRRGRFWGVLTNNGKAGGGLASSQIDNSERFNYSWDNQFNIDYTLGNDHNVKLLGLQSIFMTRTEGSDLASQRQPFETGYYNTGSGEQSTFDLGSNFVKQTLSSYALRFNYAYKGKYLLTLSNRWDGTSVFNEDRRWDSFPSGAIAWRISEEDFMSDQEVFSNLKLRASYGYTGNNIVQPYATLNALDTQVFYDFAGVPANGWLPSRLANRALTWEKTRESNFGLDFGLLRNRISGTVDVYDRLSEEILMRQTLPSESGWDFTNANIGSISNKGVEVQLTTKNIDTKKVNWETTFTFTKNTNKIESLYGQNEVDDIGNEWFIGESVNVANPDTRGTYNYVFDGIWQPGEEAEAASYGTIVGREKIRDINNDGVIDDDNDRVILGTPDPDWSGSFFTKLRIGQIDLSASVITNQGVFVYSEFHQNFADTRDRGRQKLDVEWFIPENGAGIPARMSNTNPQPRNEGSYWINDQVGYYRDASFVKVKNIALGYTLDDNVLDKLKIKYCRIYANVLNPFVFTDYEGYDPEWAGASYNNAGVAYVTYQLGLSLKF